MINIMKSNNQLLNSKYKDKQLELPPSSNTIFSYNESDQPQRWNYCFGPCCLTVVFILALVCVLSLPFRIENILIKNYSALVWYGMDNCQARLVESIPDGLNFSQNSPKFMSTYEAWQILLQSATNSIDIGSFYWTLRGADVVNHSTAAEGEEIFNTLLSNGLNKKLKISIAQNMPKPSEPNYDTEILAKRGSADIRSVNFTRLLGNGVLHTKLWIVDNKHLYLGSANMDWRSLTQVKELGILVENCPSLIMDVKKIFNAYWYLGLDTSSVPDQWPNEYATIYNAKNPMSVKFNNNFTMDAFFSNSPPPFSAKGRTDDLEAILGTILAAKSFVNIAVMDYIPLLIYTEKIRYWPYIDDAIKTAAIENGVAIKMLISCWKHSNPSEEFFLESLNSLSHLKGVDIQIKRFVVPSDDDQETIPFARVNHNKYMVTDNTAYIGTSNWSGDYFINTAGIGLVLRDNPSNNNNNNTLRMDLLNIFQRDWDSKYALNLIIE